MGHSWPTDFELPVIRLPVLDRLCWACHNRTDVKDYKRRRVHLLDGPVKIVSQMALCPDAACIGHHQLVVAEGEPLISPPWWTIGWDVFAHIGHQRFSRHQSVPSIRDELMESYDITLSEDAIEDYIGKYQ